MEKLKPSGEWGICCVFMKGNRFKKKSFPMLTYWTWRYVLVLLGTLLIIGILLGTWIRSNIYQQEFQLLQQRAEQLAEGNMHQAPLPLGKWNTIIQIVEPSGETLLYGDRNRNIDLYFYEAPSDYQQVFLGEIVRDQFKIGNDDWLQVGVPVYGNNGLVSEALYMSAPAEKTILQLRRMYISLGLFISLIGLVGWLVIYFLSRRLTRPLRDLAKAAHNVAQGDYHLISPQDGEDIRELEIQQLVQSFQYMIVRLKNLEQLRTELLAGVSHELKTPLTSIRGMIQAVQSGVVEGQEADEFLNISLNEAIRLQKMVQDLLELQSLEAGTVDLGKEPVHLNELINKVILQIKAMDEYEEIELVFQPPNRPMVISGDADRIRQILLNLISNSRDAGATQISVHLFNGPEMNQATIDVEDNGKGIDEEDLENIFERFYRGHSGRKKRHGLGVGLNISRILARAHGGDLRLVKTSPSGTVFRILLKS